jgi:hypothetical protein
MRAIEVIRYLDGLGEGRSRCERAEVEPIGAAPSLGLDHLPKYELAA